MTDRFDFTANIEPQKVGLLLPAVQAASEAPAEPTSGDDAPPLTTISGIYIRIEFHDSHDAMPELNQQVATRYDPGQDGSDLLIVNNGDGSDFF